ncbi:MAG TPA: hypothetical protein VKV74_12880 [Bryobacteraceae bacterium]|nr:hypothetical protein [Bryobacteraceae bacterium]
MRIVCQFRVILLALCSLASVAIHATAAAKSVRSLSGNIFLLGTDGRQVQLTTGGSDSMPSVSGDGKMVAFVRSGQGVPDQVCTMDLEAPPYPPPVCIAPQELVGKGDVADVSDPQLSPDRSFVYFYTQPGNLGLIIRIDLSSRRAMVIAHSVIPIAGRSFDVIQMGRYAGDLIVRKDSEKLTAGRLFLYWLVDRQGENLAIIAEKDSDAALFIAQSGVDDIR